MSKPDLVTSREIPTRAISRVSRKIARQEAFRLLTVQFDEAADSEDDYVHVDSPNNLGSIDADASYLDWVMENLDSSHQPNGATAGATKNSNSLMKRFDSIGGWSIASSFTSEVPIKEIVIDGDCKERNFAPSMESRRKNDLNASKNISTATTALNIDPQLDQLLRQIQRAEQNFRPVHHAKKQDYLKKDSRGNNHLRSLRGSFVKMYDAIRTGLNDEIVSDSASSSSLSVSVADSGTHEDDDIDFQGSNHGLVGVDKSDSAGTPKAVFMFPPELKVTDDDFSTDESLNSFLIGGCNDSVEVKMEKSKSKKADDEGKRGKFLRDSMATETTATSSAVSDFLSLRSSTLSNFSSTSFSDNLVDKLNSVSLKDDDKGEELLTSSRMGLWHRNGKRRGYSASSA